jgi:LPS export ABC transporter permease LptF
MRKLYQTYLAANFIVPFVASALFFVLFLLSFELFRITELLSSKDISFFFILGLVKDIALSFVPMAVPLALFFSTMFTISRLCSDSEYIALRASGIQKFHILLPFIFVSVLTGIMVYFLSQELIPKANKEFRTKIEYLSSSGITSGLKSGQFFTKIKNITLFPEHVDESGKEIKNIFIQIHNPNEKTDKVIYAQSGTLKIEENKQTEVESLNLLLKNGNIVDTNLEKGNIEKILFQVYEFPLSEQKFTAKIRLKENMMSRKELNRFIKNGKLAALEQGYKAKDYFNATYEYWQRMNNPLICVLFTFAGFCLGITGNRGRGQNNALIAIILIVIFYALFFGAIGMARDEKVPLPVALILPSFIFFLYNFRQYKKLDWQA